MSIIKRKKQDKFFIMDNAAVQTHLTSLNAIGLLSYITSLPSDWQLVKTNLYNKFTRKSVDSAWKELIEKKYVAGFSAYVDRKKQYFYIASDIQLTQEEYDEFVKESFYEEYEKDEFIPKNLQIIKDNQFAINFDFKKAITDLENEKAAKSVDNPSVVQNVQHLKNDNLSDVRLVQYSEYSTTSTVLKEQIQSNNIQSTKNKINKDKEIKDVNINTQLSSENNFSKSYKLRGYSSDDEDFVEVCNLILDSLYAKYAAGIFDKEQWFYIARQLIMDMQKAKVKTSDLYAYIETCIKTIIQRRKYKLGVEKPNVSPSIYNWLEG